MRLMSNCRMMQVTTAAGAAQCEANDRTPHRGILRLQQTLLILVLACACDRIVPQRRENRDGNASVPYRFFATFFKRQCCFSNLTLKSHRVLRPQLRNRFENVSWRSEIKSGIFKQSTVSLLTVESEESISATFAFA